MIILLLFLCGAMFLPAIIPLVFFVLGFFGPVEPKKIPARSIAGEIEESSFSIGPGSRVGVGASI